MSEHQLWNELGNIHINVGEYEQALGAYKKAIDLAPKSGRAQSNLATAYVRLSEPEKAIPHYQRSIELFEDFNEKASSWHQLGIAYQMLEDDKNTLLAFERAAALDPENPLYQDDLAVILSEIPDDMLDVAEVNEAPPVPAAIAKDLIPMLGEDDLELEASVDELISEISQEMAFDVDATTDTAKEDIEDEALSFEDLEEEVDDLAEAQEAGEITKHKWLALSEQDDDDTEEEESAEDLVMSQTEIVAEVEEELLSTESETVAEEPIVEIEEDETKVIVEEFVAEIEEEVLAETDKEEEVIPEVIAEESIEEVEEKVEEEFAVNETEVIAKEPVLETEEELPVGEAEGIDEAETLAEPEEEIAEDAAVATAPTNGNGNGNGNGHTDALANASVWGEMGNIFFTEDILDGALIAYKKALELDSDYGAVMHNLALLHMQKGNFAEAVKLYEQSIVYLDDNATQIKTWNNIGNAYRAMKDYDQAKEAYRKADELDTENITLENWTRQGLLSTEKS